MLCKICFTNYLIGRVEAGPEGVIAKCPVHPCEFIVPNFLFLELLPQNLLDRYKNLYNEAFINMSGIAKNFKYCPTKDCHKICRNLKPWKELTDVYCNGCGAHFCFKCQKKAHQPIGCDELIDWLKLVYDTNADE